MKRGVLAAIVAAVALGGCDGDPGEGLGLSPVEDPVPLADAPAQVADRLCRALRVCGCDELAGVSLAGCETGFRFSFDAVAEDAAEDGLTYDPACMMRRLNVLNERACEPETRFGFGCGPEPCQVFHGDRPVGAECEGSASMSNCAQGLVCGGVCMEPCSGPAAGPVGEGEVCGEEGRPIAICEEALYCSRDSDRCEPLPGAGQPCALGALCADGHFCEPGAESMCREQLPVGESCSFDPACETFLCDAGVCGPLPGAGERCGGRCAGDLVCAVEEGMQVCVSLPEVGEACLVGSTTPCREGLSCAEGRCTQPPGDGEACLPGALPSCADGLMCGGALCRLRPSAPGCETCDDPEGNCVVPICMAPPPAVCADLGGVLF